MEEDLTLRSVKGSLGRIEDWDGRKVISRGGKMKGLIAGMFCA